MTTPPTTSKAPKLPETLHIISLSLTNVGVIEAMHINPDDGKPVILSGTNGAGKTTVLSGIEAILTNANLAIRHGEDRATAKMELAAPGGTKPLFKIKRTVTERDGKQGDALEVLDFEGKQISSPRKFIDTLMGSKAALDPTELMEARPGERQDTFAKRQAETIMERLGLKQKASELDTAIANHMETRRVLKGEVDSAQARVDAIEIPKGTPETLIDVGKLAGDIDALKQLKRNVESTTNNAAQSRKNEKEWQGTVADLEKKLATAKTQLTNATKQKDADVKKMESAITAADGSEAKLNTLQTALQNATSTNAAVQNRVLKKSLQAEVTQKEAKVDSLTKVIDEIRKSRLNIVKEAKIPVEGLELTDEGLIYKGINLEDESQGNRARICALLAVSERSVRAKILIIREGSLISRENRKIIYDVAMENGWQVWEERFAEEKPKDGLWIVEGELT